MLRVAASWPRVGLTINACEMDMVERGYEVRRYGWPDLVGRWINQYKSACCNAYFDLRGRDVEHERGHGAR